VGWTVAGAAVARGVDGGQRGEARPRAARGDQAVNMGGWRAERTVFAQHPGGESAARILVRNDLLVRVAMARAWFGGPLSSWAAG